MAIIANAKSGKEFEPAPEGLWQAVCVDVVDKGVVKSNNPNWPDRHKVQIRWQINETFEDKDPVTGRPVIRRFLITRSYTLSISDKATLRHDLEAWRGRKFTAEELQDGFDVEKLIGANCQLGIVHEEGADGRVFANVSAVVPITKGTEKMEPLDYVRVKDRKDSGNSEIPPATTDDDDLPF